MIDVLRSPAPGRELAASVSLYRREAHARREAVPRPPPGWKRPRRARSRIRTRELVASTIETPSDDVILARVRRDGSPSDLREGLAPGRRELALYVAAGVVYVAIGVNFPEFLFSWIVAAGYLLLCVVALPAVVRRLRA